jgi:hypothetical protein
MFGDYPVPAWFHEKRHQPSDSSLQRDRRLLLTHVWWRPELLLSQPTRGRAYSQLPSASKYLLAVDVPSSALQKCTDDDVLRKFQVVSGDQPNHLTEETQWKLHKIPNLGNSQRAAGMPPAGTGARTSQPTCSAG